MPLVTGGLRKGWEGRSLLSTGGERERGETFVRGWLPT